MTFRINQEINYEKLIDNIYEKYQCCGLIDTLTINMTFFVRIESILGPDKGCLYLFTYIHINLIFFYYG